MKTYRSAADIFADVDRLLTEHKPLVAGKRPILDQVCRVLHKGLHLMQTEIYLLDETVLNRVARLGDAQCCATVALGQGLLGKTAKDRLSRVLQDVSSNPDYKACIAGVRSEIVVPIATSTRTFGVINGESPRLRSFGHAERVMLERVGDRLARFLNSRGKYLVREMRNRRTRSQSLLKMESAATPVQLAVPVGVA